MLFLQQQYNEAKADFLTQIEGFERKRSNGESKALKLYNLQFNFF